MAPHNTALHTNFDVDYVIAYRFTDTGELLTPTINLVLTA